MTLEDLHRVQEIDNELLFMVDDICRKYQIEYFLMFGSLLGCVRHGGSIPWDDDIDIAMTRENYLKFIEVSQKEIDFNKYILMLMGSGSPQYVSTLKIGKKGTTYCMPGTENLGIMNHIYLDIFVLESAKAIKESQLYRRMKLYNALKYVALNKSEKDLLKIAIDQSERKGKWLYKSLLDALHFLRWIIGERNIERFGYKLLVDEGNTSDSYVVIGIRYYNIFKKKWFERAEMDYSGKSVFVPSRYDEVLKESYGDYMKYPPEDKRYKKHFKKWIFKEN